MDSSPLYLPPDHKRNTRIKQWLATLPPPHLLQSSEIPPLSLNTSPSTNTPQLLSTPKTVFLITLTIPTTVLIGKMLSYTPLGNGSITAILTIVCGTWLGMWMINRMGKGDEMVDGRSYDVEDEYEEENEDGEEKNVTAIPGAWEDEEDEEEVEELKWTPRKGLRGRW
jgi:hypothetical protein